jgi:hypothetical protein
VDGALDRPHQLQRSTSRYSNTPVMKATWGWSAFSPARANKKRTRATRSSIAHMVRCYRTSSSALL